jgi:hypothetical protein
MTIQELIDKLKEHQNKTFGIRVGVIGKLDSVPNLDIKYYNFTDISYGSNRGNYCDFALYFARYFNDDDDKFTTEKFINDMTNGKTFYGYKGGDYVYSLDYKIKLAPRYDRSFENYSYIIGDDLIIDSDNIWLSVILLDHDDYYVEEKLNKAKNNIRR